MQKKAIIGTYNAVVLWVSKDFLTFAGVYTKQACLLMYGEYDLWAWASL